MGGGEGSGTSSQAAGTYIRRANHAGSWYESNPRQLNQTLGRYLSDAAADEPPKDGGPSRSSGTERQGGVPRAIISPHAGFSFSGPCAAYAFLSLREALVAGSANTSTNDGDGDGGGGDGGVFTVVVLHPSHHVYLAGAAVSGATHLQTPIGNLAVDDSLRNELLQTGEFTIMKQHVDEAEHSGEMQYPYIAKVIQDSNSAADVRVLPIMIGAVSASQEQVFGELLAPYLSRSNVFTVVSSDFCHWGTRFGYSPHSLTAADGTPCNDIADYIEWLDHQGMNHIELQRPGAFADYLREHSNTICGRHPISVWLNSLATNRDRGTEVVDVKFVKYDQSSRVRHVSESSVSYASSVARLR